ncbi:MAG: hypothetical protein ABIJ97_00140 [Bacteroidota bacterium]
MDNSEKLSLFRKGNSRGIGFVDISEGSSSQDLYETRRQVCSGSTTLSSDDGNCSASGSCCNNCAMLSFKAQSNACFARDNAVLGQSNLNSMGK